MFAGVAGGIAEWSGVDVAIVRIAIVVLTLFFGFPFVVYLVAIFVIPKAERFAATAPPQPVAALLRRRRLAALAMTVAAVLLWDFLDISKVVARLLLPLVLIGVGAVILLRRRETATPPAAAGATSGWYHSAGSPKPLASADDPFAVLLDSAPVHRAYDRPRQPAAVAAPRRRRIGRGIVIALFVLLATAGVAIALSVAFGVHAISKGWNFGPVNVDGQSVEIPFGSRTVDASSLKAHYRVRVGQISFDLDDLELTEDRAVDVVMDAGMVRVTLPKDTNVNLTAIVKDGSINLLNKGLGDTSTVNRSYVNQEAAHTLTLMIAVDTGAIEIDKAPGSMLTEALTPVPAKVTATSVPAKVTAPSVPSKETLPSVPAPSVPSTLS